jgi:hypothetical protein
VIFEREGKKKERSTSHVSACYPVEADVYDGHLAFGPTLEVVCDVTSRVPPSTPPNKYTLCCSISPLYRKRMFFLFYEAER